MEKQVKSLLFGTRCASILLCIIKIKMNKQTNKGTNLHRSKKTNIKTHIKIYRYKNISLPRKNTIQKTKR